MILFKMRRYISRHNHENYCKKILSKIRFKIKAFVFDVDGTIKSSAESNCLPLNLVKKIISKGKFVGVITASGISALENLAEQIIKLTAENNFLIPVYFGIANGMALYKLDNQGKHKIYSYPLDLGGIKDILQAWKEVMEKNKLKETDLTEKGLNTLRNFLKKDWGKLIPKNLLNPAKKFTGECFMEELKITFVMPKNGIFSREEFVTGMQKQIDKIAGKDKYIIEMGDTTFAHVTHWPQMPPKLFALNKIREEWGLREEEMVIFGDMPFGNDKGLLIDSRLPYTFTNRYFEKNNIKSPPFILPESESTPVGSVYKVVNYLLK